MPVRNPSPEVRRAVAVAIIKAAEEAAVKAAFTPCETEAQLLKEQRQVLRSLAEEVTPGIVAHWDAQQRIRAAQAPSILARFGA